MTNDNVSGQLEYLAYLEAAVADAGFKVVHDGGTLGDSNFRLVPIDDAKPAAAPWTKAGLASEEVNALPEHVRKYIMWLETNADPAGTVRENFRLTEENAGLRAMIADQRADRRATAQEAVAYLDIGVGGYLDIGSDLPEEQLLALPNGRHALGIIGTYGIDGYVSAPVTAAPVDLDALAVNRYRPVPDGLLAYKVVAGDGTRSLFSGTMNECNVVARKLTEAFLDGAHVASTPAAPGIDLTTLIPAEREQPELMLATWHEVAGWNMCVAEIRRRIDASHKGGSEARDAARWRYVRRKLCLTGNGDGTCGMQAINLPGSIPGWPDTSDDVVDFCEAAIDAAMQAQAGDAEVQP